MNKEDIKVLENIYFTLERGYKNEREWADIIALKHIINKCKSAKLMIISGEVGNVDSKLKTPCYIYDNVDRLKTFKNAND